MSTTSGRRRLHDRDGFATVGRRADELEILLRLDAACRPRSGTAPGRRRRRSRMRAWLHAVAVMPRPPSAPLRPAAGRERRRSPGRSRPRRHRPRAIRRRGGRARASRRCRGGRASSSSSVGDIGRRSPDETSCRLSPGPRQSSTIDDRAAAAAVAQRVGQALLHDPVDGELLTRRELAGLARMGDGDLRARPPRRSRSVRAGRRAGLRGHGSVEDAVDDPANVDEGGARRVGDRARATRRPPRGGSCARSGRRPPGRR